MKIRTILLSFFFALFLYSIQVVAQSENVTAEIGQIYDGALAVEGEWDQYTFDAIEGQLIEISIWTSGDYAFVPLIELIDENGRTIASDSHKGYSGSCGVIGLFDHSEFQAEVTTTIPKTGQYTLRVANRFSDYSGVRGLFSNVVDPSCKTGPYKLEFKEISTDLLDTIEPVSGEMGIIQLTDTVVTNIIAVDEIELPNCNGIALYTIEREFSKQIKKEVEFLTDNSTTADLGVGLPIPLLGEFRAGAISHIQEKLQITQEAVLTESYKATFNAEPGTKIRYEIEWVEVSQVGYAEVIQDNGIIRVPFQVPSTLQVHLREPVLLPCDE